jgi:hypothetical protein
LFEFIIHHHVLYYVKLNPNQHVDSEGFWRSCITHRITVFWTFPSSGVLETRKHDVSETGCVSVLRWKGGEYTYSVGPLRIELISITGLSYPVSETSCFLVSRIPDDGKVQKTQPTWLHQI